MGESEADRLRMLEVLSNFDPAPDSVPINCLMPMPGTPLTEQPPVDIFELVRLVAVTRIALPKARVRLAAGRTASRAKVRRSASLPAPIQFFTVTNF
jgi:biotin synthase